MKKAKTLVLTTMIGSLKMTVTGASVTDFKRKLSSRGLRFSDLRYVEGIYDSSYILRDGIHHLNKTPSLSNTDSTSGTTVHIVSKIGYRTAYISGAHLATGLVRALDIEQDIKYFDTLGIIVSQGRSEIIIFVDDFSGYQNTEFVLMATLFNNRIKQLEEMRYRAYNFIV